jgi:hypothetical protein
LLIFVFILNVLLRLGLSCLYKNRAKQQKIAPKGDFYLSDPHLILLAAVLAA